MAVTSFISSNADMILATMKTVYQNPLQEFGGTVVSHTHEPLEASQDPASTITSKAKVKYRKGTNLPKSLKITEMWLDWRQPGRWPRLVHPNLIEALSYRLYSRC
ncbi:MAG: hypothetical protein EOP04_07165 [Proteobacteria bacterium]|nr:MAG: hypothetical protein EOP04_07165 [Pseudomonadota bacterium]